MGEVTPFKLRQFSNIPSRYQTPQLSVTQRREATPTRSASRPATPSRPRATAGSGPLHDAHVTQRGDGLCHDPLQEDPFDLDAFEQSVIQLKQSKTRCVERPRVSPIILRPAKAAFCPP